MIIFNQTLVSSDENSTIEYSDSASSSSIIITIIILSFLSVSGWIFMSYALFGRSEAYRTKPEDQHGVAHPVNDSERSNLYECTTDFE